MNSQRSIPTPSTRRGSRRTSPDSSSTGIGFPHLHEGAPRFFLSETMVRGFDAADSIIIRREAIAAVPVRVRGRHGNATTPSDPPLVVVECVLLSCTVF